MSMSTSKKRSLEEQKWGFGGTQRAGKLRIGIPGAQGIRGAHKALIGNIAEAGASVYYRNGQAMYRWREQGKPSCEKLIDEPGGDAPAIWRKIQAAIATRRA